MTIEGVYSKLDELADLEENWDSYGGKKVNVGLIERAKDFYKILHSDDNAEVYVLPTHFGSIQFEWHTEAGDLEIELTVDGRLILLLDVSQDNSIDLLPYILKILGKGKL